MSPSPTPGCASVREHLTDLCDGVGGTGDQAHLRTCVGCAALVRDAVAVHGSLTALPQVALPAGFEATLSTRLERVAATRRVKATRRSFASPLVVRSAWAAVAVAVVAFAGLWLLRPASPSVDVMVTELVSVEVEVQAARALAGVQVTIALPAGLEVASDDERLVALRTLAWSTDLAPGANRFELVVRAASAGDHQLRVALASGADHATMDLAVHARRRGEQAASFIGRGALAGAPRLTLHLGGDS